MRPPSGNIFDAPALAEDAVNRSGVRIRLEGADAVLAQLKAIQARVDDTAGMFRHIGAAVAASTQERFNTGTGPDGVAWAPSARAKREAGQTLVKTARLKGSIFQQSSASGVSVGTNVIYAAIHQFGGTILPKAGAYLSFRVGGRFVRVRQVTMPARPFLGLDADDEVEILATARDWIIPEGAGDAA